MQVYEWTIEITSPDGNTVGTISSGTYSSIRPSRWLWESRIDAAASQLQITWPDASRFFQAWDRNNPLATGAKVVLKAEGFARFTGTIHECKPRYSANDKSLTVICRDACGKFKDAGVNLDRAQAVIAEKQRLVRKEAGSYIWVSQVGKYPWAGRYLIRLWVGNPDVDPDAKPIRLSEYETLYEIGAIMFRHDKVLYQNDTGGGDWLDDIEDIIYAAIVYYDSTDTSTLISNILIDALEYDADKGGLGLVEGVDFTMETTPSDKLNEIKWNTDEGDGDLVAMLSSFYNSPHIAMPPSYMIRDFEGGGILEGKLVLQDNSASIDIDMLFDAQFPSPLDSLYSRAVIINNSATRHNLTRDATLSLLNLDLLWTRVGDKEFLRDGTARYAYGEFKIQKFDWNELLPKDIPFFKFDLGSVKPIDGIYYNEHWTFTGDDNDQTVLHDPNSGFSAENGLYRIYEPQRITVEYSLDDINWFVLDPELYYSEVDILGAKDSWKKVENIGIEAKYIRVIVNNPLFGKVGESNYYNEAYRIMICSMNEFVIISKGRILDIAGEQPEVRFVDNPMAPKRHRYDLSNTLIDMYRPKLLAKLESLGLKWRTLRVEDDGVWDFSVETGLPEDVSLGYKLLVTRLDAASRENEFQVRIMPRPDLQIGNTVHASKLVPGYHFLINGFTMSENSGKLSHTLIMSDYETFEGNPVI